MTAKSKNIGIPRRLCLPFLAVRIAESPFTFSAVQALVYAPNGGPMFRVAGLGLFTEVYHRVRASATNPERRLDRATRRRLTWSAVRAVFSHGTRAALENEKPLRGKTKAVMNYRTPNGLTSGKCVP